MPGDRLGEARGRKSGGSRCILQCRGAWGGSFPPPPWLSTDTSMASARAKPPWPFASPSPSEEAAWWMAPHRCGASTRITEQEHLEQE